MTADAQNLFLHRIFYLHEIATRRAGKASSVKLTLAEWVCEADKIVVLAHVLSQMSDATDSHGDRLFPDALISKLFHCVVEGRLVWTVFHNTLLVFLTQWVSLDSFPLRGVFDS